MTVSRAAKTKNTAGVPPSPPRLLITAFGTFDGGPNCSEALLGRLAVRKHALEALWGGPVLLALLPVRAETAELELRRALDAARPTHVLLTGQAAGRALVTFERIARNHLFIGVPDGLGRIGAGGPVRNGGPAERRANWPALGAVASAIAEAGVPAGLSDDAGSHLCNQTLYLALEAAETAEPSFVVTFMHLPLTPDQVAAGVPAAVRHPGCFAMPLDDMERAVEAVLVHTRRAAAQLDA